MSQPKTELDARFSDPGADPTTWQQTLAALEAGELFWVTTVRADGRPHVTPLVAVWLDDALHFCTGPEEQKARNLEREPARRPHHRRQRVGHRAGRDGGGRGPPGHRRRRRWSAWPRPGAASGTAGGSSRPGTAGSTTPTAGVALVYAVRPAKVLAFGKGTFSHTRHVPR